MVGQTMCSFETRTGTTQASGTRSKTNNLGCTSSSSTVVVFDEIAPSDLEIYDQAGLVPPSKNEKVVDHRIRIDENMLRVSTNIVAIHRCIDQLKAMVSARFKEVILHVQDLNSSPATAGVIPPTVTADIECVKSLTMEGRTAITNLTLAMDPLVNLPGEVERLSRTVLNLTMGSRNAAESSAHATVTQKNCTS